MATESGNAGIEIVLGERFPSVTVFGLSLARGGHQTMEHAYRSAGHAESNRVLFQAFASTLYQQVVKMINQG